MRIALLEDETEQAQHIQSILSERGHHCDSFPTGQNFLSAVLHRSYDLLVLDWQIPDMTGIDVLESVRAQLNWPIPMVFLTQRDSEADIVRALDAGADDYLAKPARAAELVARIFHPVLAEQESTVVDSRPGIARILGNSLFEIALRKLGFTLGVVNKTHRGPGSRVI